jgi:P2-related tail formation protein
MSLLRESIRRVLIQEKTIAQIVTSIEVTFNLEVDRKKHAFDRSTRPELEGTGYNQRPIENREIREVVTMAKSQIAEKIVNREIKDGEAFVVKSEKWELAIPLNPVHISGTNWVLEVFTVFRESSENPFRTGKNQIVIWV